MLFRLCLYACICEETCPKLLLNLLLYVSILLSCMTWYNSLSLLFGGNAALQVAHRVNVCVALI